MSAITVNQKSGSATRNRRIRKQFVWSFAIVMIFLAPVSSGVGDVCLAQSVR